MTLATDQRASQVLSSCARRTLVVPEASQSAGTKAPSETGMENRGAGPA